MVIPLIMQPTKSTFRSLESSPCMYACTGTQSCWAHCNPMNSSPPGSSVHVSLQARILEWVAMPSSRRSS